MEKIGEAQRDGHVAGWGGLHDGREIHGGVAREDGAVLVTTSPKQKGRDLSNVTCNNCGEKGHMWRSCPKPYATALPRQPHITNSMIKGKEWGEEREAGDSQD